MAGLEADENLELDGCDILPLIQGESDRVMHPDGTEREAIFWFYPMESHMAVVMRKGDWKLVNNLGVSHLGQHAGVKNEAGVELFRLQKQDGSAGDLGEEENLAAEFPELRDAMLAEVEAFVTAAGGLYAIPESEGCHDD